MSRNLIGLHKRAQGARQQDQRGAEGEKGELWCTTCNRVVRRPATGADPHRGNRQKRKGGHRNADAEAHSLES